MEKTSYEYWFKWKTKTILKKSCFKEDQKITYYYFCIMQNDWKDIEVWFK